MTLISRQKLKSNEPNFNTELLFSIGHSRKLHTNNGTQYMYHWNEPYFTPSLCPRNLNEEFRANFALLLNISINL